jgi:excisionase family DNA binding protein
VVKLSVREAAKRFDVSRPTLVKHLKSGKLSGEPVDGGGWLIDSAEMVRAGYKARVEVVNPAATVPGNLTTIASPAVVNDGAEIAALKAALAQAETRATVAEALATERAAHIEDLRRMLPAPDAKPKRSWWPW